MRRRAALLLPAAWAGALMTTGSQTMADSTSPTLASYYARHMALAGGVAHGWVGQGAPRRLMEGVRQVGVSRDAWFALRDNGELVTWTDAPERAATLMRSVASFAAGQSGWFAIDRAMVLWHGSAGRTMPQRIAEHAVAACIGDSADYYIAHDGALFVKGLAHRGQYGDGKLTPTPEFVTTAADALAVAAHTGHAIYLRRDGVVLGTGGNRFGPLSSHGLGDKAERWGPIFEGAAAIATGSRHSVALRPDGPGSHSLWAWGEGFATEPRKLRDGVLAVAAGDTATIAWAGDGTLWQWEAGAGPQRVALRLS